KNLEEYWKGVIRDCKTKRDLSEYKIQRERLLSALLEVDEKIRMAEADLDGSSRNFREDDISDNRSDLQMDLSGDLRGVFDENFSGNLDGGPIYEDDSAPTNAITDGSGSQNPQIGKERPEEELHRP
ncbi:9408_t:CDS:2, partial [Funneliformis caledonium]